MMLPNGVDLVAVYFAATQIGLYVVPVNWHLVGAEVAYLLTDSQAKVFVAHQRFDQVAIEAVQAVDESRLRPQGPVRGRGGGRLPAAVRPGRRSATRSTGRTDAGAPMVYTSGTTGRPKGVRRALTGADPDLLPPAGLWFFGIFNLAPFDGHVHLCCSPLYHTAVLNVATLAVQHGHPAVLMDRFDAEEMLRLIERERVTYSHMVPTQFSRLLALPDDVRARYDVSSLRVMIHRRRAVPAGGQAADARVVGAVVTEYYAATEGGGDDDQRGRVGGAAGVGRAARGPGPSSRCWTTRARRCRPGRPGWSTCGWGPRSSSTHKDREKTLAARVGSLLHARGHRLPRRGRVPVPLRPQGRHDHHRRRQRVPGGDRGRAGQPSGRRRRRRLRHSAPGVG
jgi:long-chain acyl-CoA synthetase